MLNIIKEQLSLLHYASEKINAFEELVMQQHNYGTIKAFSDSLSYLNIENMLIEIPFANCDQLPDIFIAKLDFLEIDFFLVRKEEGNFVINKTEGKKIYLSNVELEKAWSGFVFLVEENDNKPKKNITSFLKYELLIVAICIVLQIFNSLKFINLFFIITSLIGFHIGIEIISEKLYVVNNKFCKSTASCNSILKSKLFYNIEFKDLPIVFFSGALLILIFQICNPLYIGFVSLLSLPILIYSLYLQIKVIKKKCIYCLTVSALLLLNSVVFLFFFKAFNFENKSFLNVIVVFFVTALTWKIIKKLKNENVHIQEERNSLLRFKRNPKLFEWFSSDLNYSIDDISSDGVLIGNESASNTLILVLSPLCHHCYSAYKKATELVSKFPDIINFKIVFSLELNQTKSNDFNFGQIIMSLNTDLKKQKEALDDWYISKMNYEEWVQKWFLQTSFLEETKKLLSQDDWLTKNQIEYTPFIILNDKKVDISYDIEELYFFLK